MKFTDRWKNFTFYPFGAEIRYKPSSPKVQNQMSPFGAKTLPGIFLGYHEHKGGYFSGDLLLADWEDIAVATHVSEIPIRRLPYQEVFCIKRNGDFIYPLAEGTLAQPLHSSEHSMRQRNRQEKCISWKEITTDEDIPQDDEDSYTGGDSKEIVDEEEPTDLLEESGGSVPCDDTGNPVIPEEDVADPDLKDYWTLTYDTLTIHHLRPRLRLFVPNRSNIPIPLTRVSGCGSRH